MTDLIDLQARLTSITGRVQSFDDDTLTLEAAVEDALDKERECRGKNILSESPKTKLSLTKAKTAVNKAEAELSEHRSNKEVLHSTINSLKSEISTIKAEALRKRNDIIREAMPELMPVLASEAQTAIARVMVASSLRTGSPLAGISPKHIAMHICLEEGLVVAFREALVKAQTDIEHEVGL